MKYALEKQAASACEKVEDLESDVHAQVAQWSSLPKTVGEKKKLVQELEETEKK